MKTRHTLFHTSVLAAAILFVFAFFIASAGQSAQALSPFTVPGPKTAQAAEKILVSISNDDIWSDDTLYTLNPDGTGQTALFNFHSHPKDPAARILQPRIAPGGGTIYFSSEAAYLYTPASRNLFRIASDGNWWDQITPDVNSGLWNQPGPYGIVEGKVEYSDGTPIANSSIYLEGMDLQYSGPDGSFRFENVPEGKRWIVAYDPGDSNNFDAEEIFVANGAPWNATLVPGSDSYMEFQNPVVYGDRIYHTLGFNSLGYTDVDASAYTTIYQVSGTCSYDGYDIDGFDIGSQTGKLAIMDFATGCTTNRGLYTADKDGNNLQLLVDMKDPDPNWCEGGEVFWSPDESKLAVEACYNWYTWLLVYDATDGTLLGSIYFPDTYTLINVTLHGWSPDGNWLLFSYWLNSQANTNLDKIAVNNDGSLDDTNIVSLLANVKLSGATWGSLGAATCTTPLTGISISGPSSGSPSTAYTFNANVAPANASTPISYTWSPVPVSGQGTSSAQYNWTTTGAKSISVTATNCSGSSTANDTHTINISTTPTNDQKVYIPLVQR